MEVKESKEIATNLKFGLTVALSLGGALYTYHRIKNIKVPPGKKISSSSPYLCLIKYIYVGDITS